MRKGSHHTQKSIEKMGRRGPNSGSFRKGASPWNIGKKLGPNPEHSTRMKGRVPRKTWKLGHIPWNKGKKLGPLPEKECRKRRLTMLRKIEERCGQVHPGYNPTACRLIEAYGKKHGYTFQHAENGGEFHIKALGYFVDGYDAQQNVVIEVDEPRHYRNSKLLPEDVRRQREIERHLGCTFVRIKA